MLTKKDPRDKTGAIIHTAANRVLSNHTVKNIYGNVNYCKYFMQGTVIDVFNGHAPGGKNAIWKLTPWPGRRARPQKRRKPPSPLTFVCCRCGC
jgi:hypothetical protein